MPFLEDVDAIKKKAAIAPARLPVLIGTISLCLALVVIGFVALFQAVATPTFQISSSSSSATSVGSEDSSQTDSSVIVHVAGGVVSPGVYRLPSQSRVQDAVDAAGGFSEDALPSAINLARCVLDGEQVMVPVVVSSPETDELSPQAESAQATPSSSLVNINTASQDNLTSLPGIGDSTAEKIVASRMSEGPFTSKEDIQRVSGIGQKKYEAIADLICV